MSTKKQREYAKDIEQSLKRVKNIIVEKPEEIAEDILGLPLTEFEVLGPLPYTWHDEAYCAAEEIFLSFQGKEMRIYIEDGKLCVYTD